MSVIVYLIIKIHLHTLLGDDPTNGCITPPKGTAQSALRDSNYISMQNIPDAGKACVVRTIGESI